MKYIVRPEKVPAYSPSAPPRLSPSSRPSSGPALDYLTESPAVTWLPRDEYEVSPESRRLTWAPKGQKVFFSRVGSSRGVPRVAPTVTLIPRASPPARLSNTTK